MNSGKHNHNFRFTMYHHSLAGGSVQLHRNYIIKDNGLDITLQDDEVYYRNSLGERIQLDNWDYKLHRKADVGDYERMLAIEAEGNICDDIRIVIERWCNDAWIHYYTGVVQVREMSFDPCKCTVTFLLKPDDYYRCLQKRWEVPINFHELPTTDIGVLDVGVEAHLCYAKLASATTATGTPTPFTYTPPIPPGTPDANLIAVCPNVMPLTNANTACADLIALEGFGTLGGMISSSPPQNSYPGQCPEFWWVKQSSRKTHQVFSYAEYIETLWWRETVTVGSGTTPPGDGWILLNDDGTIAKYIRCPLSDSIPHATQYNFKFTQVLEHVFNGTMENCAHSGICSNLLGLNPDGVYPNNSAYQYALQHLQHLHITAIEDAQPGLTDPELLPSEYELTFKQIYEDLKKLNIFMRFDADGKLRIEHISYFRNPDNILVLDNECAEFKYRDNEFPVRERFEYPNDASKEFLTAGIFYDMHPCAEPDTTESTDLSTFDADIAFHQSQDEPTKGWLWLAPEFDQQNASNPFIITNANYEMSWIKLVPSLLAHDRPHLFGRFEHNDIDFETLRPRREITLDYLKGICCDNLNNYDPNQLQQFLQVPAPNISYQIGVLTKFEENVSTGLHKVRLIF